MGGHRTAICVLSLVVGAGVLAGCGHGSSPLATSSTTATTAPPAASTTTTTAATTTTTAPSTTTTSTTVPKTTTTAGKPPAGLPYPASYAHFSADFPAAPQKNSVPESVGTFQLRVYVAVAHFPNGVAEAAEEDISPPLPAAGDDAAMNSALKAITTTSTATLVGQPAAATFRSYHAYGARYKLGSEKLRGLAFMADGGARLYIVIATTKIFKPFSATLKLTK
jgi:hypothetical protein